MEKNRKQCLWYHPRYYTLARTGQNRIVTISCLCLFAACFLCAPMFCQSVSLCVVSLCFSLTLCQFVCFCPGVALSSCLVYCSSFCMDVAFRFVPRFVFSYLLDLLSLRLLCMHLDFWILALLMMMPFVF